jgi:hypothetical protein
LAAKSENDNFAQVFKSLSVNQTFRIVPEDLPLLPLNSLVFLKQETVLEKILTSSAELRNLDDEMEKGNLYELMNEIEVKLQHYDFKSDDFVQLKEIYLQRLQLERELEELKKKGQEYDELL